MATYVSVWLLCGFVGMLIIRSFERKIEIGGWLLGIMGGVVLLFWAFISRIIPMMKWLDKLLRIKI
jgi:hypothetical protein